MKNELLEKLIVGYLVYDLRNIIKVLQILSVDDFIFYRKHVELVLSSFKENKDLHIGAFALGIKSSELIELSELVPVHNVLEASCKELKELQTSSKLKTILAKAQKEVPETKVDEFVAELQQQLIRNINTSNGEDSRIESVVQEFTEMQLEYEEKKKNGQELIGISCGFPKLDNVIDGIRKGHFWVIGGYTSMGKTFSALNIVSHLVKQKKRVVIYTLEMSRVDVLSRTLGILTGNNSRGIQKGYVDQSKIKPALKIIEDSNLTIISSKRELSQILLSMHEETLKSPVDLFVVDYIGLVQVKGAKSEYEQIKAVALELQEAGKRFDTPVLALSQLSNESAKAGEQQVMGFKGAGDIAAASDLAIILMSGEESNVEMKVKMQKGEAVKIKWVIQKNRHGSTGYLHTEFNGKTGTFTELDDNNY